MRRETVRMKDGDMMELQSANGRTKRKREGGEEGVRGCKRERLQSTSKAAVMKSRV